MIALKEEENNETCWTGLDCLQSFDSSCLSFFSKASVENFLGMYQVTFITLQSIPARGLSKTTCSDSMQNSALDVEGWCFDFKYVTLVLG